MNVNSFSRFLLIRSVRRQAAGRTGGPIARATDPENVCNQVNTIKGTSYIHKPLDCRCNNMKVGSHWHKQP